ncbi:MAG: hypothetical protein KAI66_25185, partial [Lentisphaeria bacterium]|nr:hypothetical protein [Lentisphaeria bacterium]
MRTADGLNVLPYAYIIDRNEGLQPLAEAEACHLADGVVAAPGVVEGRRVVRSAETGFVRSGGKLLAKGKTLEEICENIAALGLTAHRFRVASEPIPRKRTGAHRAVRAVAHCIGGTADLRDPLEEFLLVVSDAGFWLIRLSEPGDSKWLAFVDRPHPFCNALPLSVGRAVLNLVAKPGDTVYDP